MQHWRDLVVCSMRVGLDGPYSPLRTRFPGP